MLLAGSPVQAESWHIKPSSEVPIRSGQGTEYKILAVVPDGLRVELLEEIDPWARVQTPGGTEGWILKRYLTSDPPLSEIMTSVKAENKDLKQKEDETSRKYDELLAAYSQMEQEYNACLTDRDDIREKYQLLQEDTADVIQIKDNLSKATQENQEIRQTVTAVQQENKDLKNNSAVKWFLTGSFVLILGWLIGLLTGRSRKRKSSLY